MPARASRSSSAPGPPVRAGCAARRTRTRSAAARRRDRDRRGRPSVRPRAAGRGRRCPPARSSRGGSACRPARTSRSPVRWNSGSVSMMSFSTRPGTATISLTRRTPWASMPRCTTRSVEAATVGTTNRDEMFSPASSGSVHSLTSASRALLAWIVARPGSPALRASSRSRHSADRTSPTIIRVGRIRSASRTRSRKRDLARALQALLPGLHRHPVGVGEAQLEDLLGTDHPVTTGDRRGEAVQERGLPCLGAAGDHDVQPRQHGGLEEPRCLSR